MMAVLTENYGGKWYVGEKERGGGEKEGKWYARGQGEGTRKWYIYRRKEERERGVKRRRGEED